MRFASALFVVVIALVAGACGRPVPGGPPDENGGNNNNPGVPGTLGGRCADGGFCNDDLVCNADNVCEAPVVVGEGEGEGEEGEGEGEGEGGCDVDADRDGSCAGDDCDDLDPNRYPEATERCSFIDENCDGQMNDFLDCTFVAHTRDQLFTIDPFAQTVEPFRTITLIDNAGLLDIDIDVQGDLIAGTRDGLYEVRDNGTLAAVVNVDAPPSTNGICITGNGTMFLTNDDDADSAAWKVEGNQIVEVGGFSGGLVSSGDCVVTKEEDVLMSAKNPDLRDAPDRLVEVDSSTGNTSDIGSIGFAKVFGLSASFGFLFGVTETGQVLEINRNTGAGRVLFVAQDRGTPIRFAGAANGD